MRVNCIELVTGADASHGFFFGLLASGAILATLGSVNLSFVTILSVPHAVLKP